MCVIIVSLKQTNTLQNTSTTPTNVTLRAWGGGDYEIWKNVSVIPLITAPVFNVTLSATQLLVNEPLNVSISSVPPFSAFDWNYREW
jgi:hypothetical protein